MTVDQELEGQCDLLGLDVDQLVPQEIRADAEHRDSEWYEVWPEHWNAVLLFQRCRRSWRLAVGMGGATYLGFDYAAVEVVLRRMGLRRKEQDEAFEQLQVMEEEAVALLNNR